MAGPDFPSAPNFRDLGGYAAGVGRRVRHGVLYRSGQLAKLTDDETPHNPWDRRCRWL